MPRASNKVVELTTPILQNMELAACRTAEAVAEVMEFGEDKSAEVAMALIEACLNSFEHSRSKDKKVYITFLLEDGILKIILRDRGRGNVNFGYGK
ncbi:MAG: hypothetical protein GTO29_13470 [Candidatus Latescibacteria bacterium]|nr:hypothetical protein [Candidatus Latescibacterota bacterium]NIO57261.1 hypothetical protein [Candidatus Latescibacterota bacterium]